MRKTVFYGLLVIILAFGFIACDDGNSNDGNGNGNGNGGGNPYAGNWVDLTGNGRKIVIIENNSILNFTISLNMPTLQEAIKGTVQIDGTSVTLTYTSITNGQGGWTSDPNDMETAAPFLGNSPVAGTITGSSVGSTLSIELITDGGTIIFTKQ
jgi:hypothetical protein